TASFSFVLTLLRLRRRRCGNDTAPVEHAGRAPPFGTRKSSRAMHSLFFICTHCSARWRRQCAQMKNSPLRGCFCSLVPVVGLEPTRILLHRILSPARLPVSPHRRR